MSPPAGSHRNSRVTLRIARRTHLLLEHYHYSPGAIEPLRAHVHATWQFGWSPDAAGEHLAHGSSHRTAPHEFSLIAPGEVHAPSQATYVEQPSTFVMVFVEPDLIARMARDDGLTGTWRSGVRGIATRLDRSLNRRFIRAASLSLSSQAEPLAVDEAWDAYLEHLVVRHVVQLSAPVRRHNEPQAVALVRELLHSQPWRAWSLDELATVAGLSASRLRHAFRSSAGLPPHAYALRLRIDRARALLAAGVAPIDVAARGGFADQSHFGRHFRRIVGVTPGRFQAMTRARPAVSF